MKTLISALKVVRLAELADIAADVATSIHKRMFEADNPEMADLRGSDLLTKQQRQKFRDEARMTVGVGFNEAGTEATIAGGSLKHNCRNAGGRGKGLPCWL